MDKKITVAENYDRVIATLNKVEGEDALVAELVAFIEDRKAKSKKSSSKSKELDEGQKALITEVERVLTESGVAMSIGEMQKKSEMLKELTTSKISANIQKVLVNPINKPINPDGTIERSMDKKVAKFTYVGSVPTDTEEENEEEEE